MAFNLSDLATELGIDPATLAAKGEVVAKWNGYLSEADTKYTQATAAQRAAEEKLEAVQREQQAIDANIASFGMTEANVIALRANNAAMEATLKSLKEGGLDVNIPAMPAAATPTPGVFDPAKFQQDVNATLVAGFNANNRYQRLYGKALPDDVDVLAREAAAARQPFDVYVAQKYDFKGEETRQTAAAQTKRDEEIRSAAVKEYQEKNPVTAGHHELQRGVASRHPQLAAQRQPTDKGFANMSTRQKIAQSVGRTQQVLNSQNS